MKLFDDDYDPHISDVYVYHPITDLRIPSWYMVSWYLRTYCMGYYLLCRRSFRMMKIGNVFSTLLDVFRNLLYAYNLASSLIHRQRMAIAAYCHLGGHPTDIDILKG